MLQFVLTASRSGGGKTTAACALLAALAARGQRPCAFKAGPDYIDPMFHRAVLGVKSHNLDLYFSAPDTVRRLYAQGAADCDAAVCEGAMGYYDGLGGVTDTASAWQLADTLELPALRVVRPKGASLTLAAELRGLLAFRTPHHIAGILLNDCSESLFKLLAPMLEKETGLPVVGYLPHLPEAAIESRHLGLKTAAEIADLQQKIEVLADAAQRCIDWHRLYTLFDRPAPPAPPQTAGLPRAISSAVSASLSVCGCVVFFRIVGAVIRAFLPVPPLLLSAALEISAGCADAAARGGQAALYGCCAVLSLLGLSVWSQIQLFSGDAFCPRALLLSRVLHFFFLQGLIRLCVRFLPGSLAVCSSLSARVVPISRLPPDAALLGFSFLCAALYKVRQNLYNK